METTTISLKARVKALDDMIVSGDILGAVEAFFHSDVQTQEGNAEDIIDGKEGKIAHLRNFFAGIAKVNTIELHSQAVGDEVTMSEFTFDLTKTDGEHILWNEVLRRRWKDGLVIHERYYTAS